MKKYIDPSKIRLTAVGTVDEDGDILVSVRDVKKAIDQTPAADVVPKSEVDKWYHEYHAIKDELKQERLYHKATEKLADKYCVELITAKTEVAREIFAEIYDRLLTSFPAQSFIDAPCTTHDRLFDMIVELKKKYTGEQE